MQRRRLALWISAVAMTLVAVPAPAGVAEAAEPTIVVAPGDTLIAISRRHGVSVEQLVALNRIANPSRIYAGQRLVLAGEAKPAPKPKPAAPAAATRRSHLVVSGENLTFIARRYGVTVAAIASANKIADPSRIFAGQRIAIPGTAPAPSASNARPKPTPKPPAAAPIPQRTHLVAGGENLTFIARRYGVTVAAIASANKIADPSRIFAGQRLVIPGAAAPTAKRPSAPKVPASMSSAMAARDATRRIILAEAKRYGVSPSLALAVAWQESGWRQDVVSHSGAVGVMQLMPATGEWVGEAMLGASVDLRDARSNIRAGVRLLRHYVDRYRGNLDLVLAAYYQGQRGVDRHGVYPMTRPYIASVRALIRALGG
ncbi:MAG TPA: LysM peptidoglycan-binding domain-containing protein [Candidatus Limnocylindria bacterium]|nr:LysM peptidoglycan-binding domain-containing protein [Candidatus Limnocylindria bacterium]